MHRHLFSSLAAATVTAMVCSLCCLLVPPVHAFLSPRVALRPAQASTAGLSRRRRHFTLYARLKNTGNKVDLDPDEVQRLFHAFLRGDRLPMQQYEEQRRLQAEQAEEDTQGLWGKVKHVYRGIVSKAPLLLLAPVVLWLGVQLSGLAVALALTSAVVMAGFALPPLFALTFVVPLLVLTIAGIFVFPILPFAILGFLPGFVLLPLLFLAGVFWLTQFSASSRGSGGMMGGEEGSWPWGNSGFSWISIDSEDEEGDGVGRGGGRRAGGRGGGVIDVNAVEDDEEEDESGRELDEFDRRLRDRE